MKYNVFMLCPPWKKYRLNKKFKVILMDNVPPKIWRARRAFDFLKNCLTELSDNEHAVYAWVTAKFTDDCREYIEGLGYNYVTTLFWKRPKWKPGSFCEVFEYLMVFEKKGYKPSVKNYPDPLEAPFNGNVKTRGEKPDDAYALIEQLHPTGAKIQLYGSCRRPGWDVFHRNYT